MKLSLFFIWNEDKILIVKYSRSEDAIKSSFTNIIEMRTRILISRDLVYFTTIVGKLKMSGCWCY